MSAAFASNRPGRLLRVEPVPPRPGAERAAFLHFLDDLDRPCAVYAALAIPSGPGPHPVLVHCPGGTQTVDEADLRWWASQGFACAALDWQHGWYAHHQAGRKSCWPPGTVLQSQPAGRVEQLIIPIAIRAVGVVIDWLSAIPGLDGGRLGLTGISWGGYLTWAAGAHEPRVRALAPVYGCGGLFAPGHAQRPPVGAALARRWAAAWDPLALAARQHAPACYLSGSDDFFGRLRHGAELLGRLRVPWRCCWAPNRDHSLDAGAGRLAAAWMRHHLAGGPPLPAAPAWDADGRLVIDPTHPPAAVEPWWTPSGGDDDRRCWWPGEPPPGAPVRARLALLRWADGTSQSTPPWFAGDPGAPIDDLGDAWPEARAGLGWHWGWSTTQLHGDGEVRCSPLADPAWVRLDARSDAAPASLLLFQVADPRWNRPGVDGIALSLRHPELPACVRIVASTSGPAGRHEAAAVVPVTGGRMVLRRADLAGLPAAATWQDISRLELADLPRRGLELGALVRMRSARR